jgi:aspartate/methionine/tyrosine aminotransferase
MHRLLSDIPGVTCLEPQGAFYCYPNLTSLLERDLGGTVAHTTMDLADLVLEQAKVAFVPGEAFGTPGYGRFSFALGDDDLAEGIRRLAELAAR